MGLGGAFIGLIIGVILYSILYAFLIISTEINPSYSSWYNAFVSSYQALITLNPTALIIMFVLLLACMFFGYYFIGL